jgi:hypothetical protein
LGRREKEKKSESEGFVRERKTEIVVWSTYGGGRFVSSLVAWESLGVLPWGGVKQPLFFFFFFPCSPIDKGK